MKADRSSICAHPKGKPKLWPPAAVAAQRLRGPSASASSQAIGRSLTRPATALRWVQPDAMGCDALPVAHRQRLFVNAIRQSLLGFTRPPYPLFVSSGWLELPTEISRAALPARCDAATSRARTGHHLGRMFFEFTVTEGYMKTTITLAALGAIALAASSTAALAYLGNAGRHHDRYRSRRSVAGRRLRHLDRQLRLALRRERIATNIAYALPVWLIWSTPWQIAGGRIMLDTTTGVADAWSPGGAPAPTAG